MRHSAITPTDLAAWPPSESEEEVRGLGKAPQLAGMHRAGRSIRLSVPLRAAERLCRLLARTSCWSQLIAMQDEKAQLLKRLAVADASIKRGQAARRRLAPSTSEYAASSSCFTQQLTPCNLPLLLSYAL